MDFPLISVIVSCYNHEKYIQECLLSVINQSYRNVELIVINDGSQDKSHEKILQMKELCDKRFKKFVYINKNNEGVAKSLNLGVKISQGDFISFLGSDDVFLPNKLQTLVSEFLRLGSEYAVACGNSHFINEQGKIIAASVKVNGIVKKYWTFLEYYLRDRITFNLNKEFGNYKSFLEGNYLPAMATLINKNSFLEVGGMDENISIEDYDIWLKLSRRYRFKYIDDVVAYYRVHESNMTKIKKAELLRDSVLLLLREKKFCLASGYKEEWIKGISSALVSMLRLKPFPLRVVFEIFKLMKRSLFWVISERIKLLFKTWQ